MAIQKGIIKLKGKLEISPFTKHRTGIWRVNKVALMPAELQTILRLCEHVKTVRSLARLQLQAKR